MSEKYTVPILILFVIGVGLWLLFGHYVTKYQLNNSEVKHDCGYFERYEVVNESRSGKVELLITYIYIKSNSGNNFKFRYQGRLHEKMRYIETDLKPGQKLCFDYIFPLFKGGYGGYGETFLKSIQLEGKM